MYVVPITGVGTANVFSGVELVGFFQLLIGVGHNTFFLYFSVFGSLLARVITLGAKAPGISLGKFVACLIEKIDMISLLNRFTSEASVVLDEILEIGFSADHVIAFGVLMPSPVRTRPHRVHTG